MIIIVLMAPLHSRSSVCSNPLGWEGRGLCIITVNIIVYVPPLYNGVSNETSGVEGFQAEGWDSHNQSLLTVRLQAYVSESSLVSCSSRQQQEAATVGSSKHQ